MVTAIDQSDSDADHGIARDEALLERFAHALFDAGHIFFRDDTAHDFVFKLKRLLAARWQGVNLQPDVAELAMPAALALMATLGARVLANRFTIGDALIVLFDLDAKFALHALDGDVDVRFSHAGDERFSRLLVAGDMDGW